MDNRKPFIQPHESDATFDGHPSAESRRHLVALGERLKDTFEVELTGEGLVVHNRSHTYSVLTVVCHRRPDDGGRWWYFASCGKPIVEVDLISDAVIAVKGYLGGRS